LKCIWKKKWGIKYPSCRITWKDKTIWGKTLLSGVAFEKDLFEYPAPVNG